MVDIIYGLVAGHCLTPAVPGAFCLISVRAPPHAWRWRLGAHLSGVQTCICETGTTGYISTDMNPTPTVFSKDCLDEVRAQQ